MASSKIKDSTAVESKEKKEIVPEVYEIVTDYNISQIQVNNIDNINVYLKY